MQCLKCVFAAWALASRAFAADQAVNLFKVRISADPLWDFSYLGNVDTEGLGEGSGLFSSFSVQQESHVNWKRQQEANESWSTVFLS